jgi:hypothetical protein
VSGGIAFPNLQGPLKVKDLLVEAYLIAHILGGGESLSLVKAASAFRALNDIIERATLKKTFSHYQAEIEIPLQANVNTYTVGPSSAMPAPTVTAARPVELLSAFARRDGHDLPVFVTHAKGDYDAVPSKSLTTQGWHALLYYQATYPAGTLYLYPVPADSRSTLHVTVLANVAPFTHLEEDVSLPPGYTQYLKYSLAKQLAASHGMPFGVENDTILQEVREALESNNIKPFPVAGSGLVALASYGSAYDIRSDQGRGT